MQSLYEGYGVLFDDAGLKVDEVDYSFFANTERGIRGSIWSVDQTLPRVTTYRLVLTDRTHFIVVWLGDPRFDPLRQKYRYLLYAASDQPDDPNNLAPQTPRPRT